MDIISISLPADLLSEMDRLIKSNGYKGRSELVRTALRQMTQEYEPPGPHIHGSITVSYAEGKEGRVSEVRHEFHDVVLSLMHTHCEDDLCMDVLIVGGKAERVLALAETLRRMRDIVKCQLIQVSRKAS
ncbi:MAG: CopG family ribbon-helix-helix protein [Thermoplasmatota archaeon]